MALVSDFGNAFRRPIHASKQQFEYSHVFGLQRTISNTCQVNVCFIIAFFLSFFFRPVCVCAGDRAMIIIGENGRIDWLGLSKNEHVEIAQHRSVANKNHSHSSTWKSESEECVARHRCPNTKQTKIKCSQTAITTTNNNNNKQRRQKKNNGSAHTINEEKKKRERETQKTPTTSRAICNVCRFHLVCGQCSHYFCCHKW